MYLLIDAGNTRLKLGCHSGALAGEPWLLQTAIAHGSALPLPAGFVPRLTVIANVAGPAVLTDVHAQLAQAGIAASTIHLLAPGPQFGTLHNDYAKPAQLGVDRWAAAIGAWSLQQGACLVVSAGTATTVDVLDAHGHFRGGCILPGLSMMQAALAQGTAGLPHVQALPDLTRIPDNTSDAIASGCLHAQLGAISRIAALLDASAPVLLCGGAAPALLAGMGDFGHGVKHVPALVLEGLLRVALSLDNASQ